MNIGKIIDYTGSSGFIVDNNGNKFIVSSNNILYSNTKCGDLVSFNIERFNTVEIDKFIATFVKKININ